MVRTRRQEAELASDLLKKNKSGLVATPIAVTRTRSTGGSSGGSKNKGQDGDASTSLLEEAFQFSDLNQTTEEIDELDDDILESIGEESATIVKGVNAIIIKAVKLQASDIHIEPYEDHVRIRYRIDGVLVTEKKLPKDVITSIVSRIKIMCELNISEKRLPQDGRFRIKMGNRKIDFRVSTLRTLHGEKVVMRILDQSAVSLELPTLGFEEDALGIINKVIQDPYGIILVTGPTGSGKSTTLYSILVELNKEDVNISTTEDPVEYELPGINQVQCKSDIGLTFSTTLRSFLRQDPDVIMVGEIRDGETAEISIKAALTGHLVLSTLHTNDAPSTVHRLLNMGIEPFLISASLSMIIAQRLVRKNCPHCIAEDETAHNKLLSMNQDDRGYDETKFKRSKGCSKCNNTGYKGRSVLYEIMVLDEEMRAFIAKGSTSIELEKMACDKGMVRLRELGMKKALAGITSLEEVMKVTIS
ncbi:MAG: type II/IV secretion system protein [Psychrilyobacter sp.]|nr:type II/IV secretion system protein [Psychrilyobacter sp.]